MTGERNTSRRPWKDLSNCLILQQRCRSGRYSGQAGVPCPRSMCRRCTRAALGQGVPRTQGAAMGTSAATGPQKRRSGKRAGGHPEGGRSHPTQPMSGWHRHLQRPRTRDEEGGVGTGRQFRKQPGLARGEEPGMIPRTGCRCQCAEQQTGSRYDESQWVGT